MTYATFADYENWYTATKSQALTETALTWATEQIDTYTGTKFTSTAYTETQYGDGYQKVFLLTRLPVISLTSASQIDDSGTSTSLDVDHTLLNIGEVHLDTTPYRNYRVVFVYNYGDTARIETAKLANIHLAKAAIDFFDMSGGIFPAISVRKGDIEYTLSQAKANTGVMMSITNIMDSLKIRTPALSKGQYGGGFYERLRRNLQ